VQVRFIKILLTGSGAAGKTSFSNLLMRKQFNSKHHSTKVVQSKNAISVRCKQAVLVESNETDDQDVTWVEMDDDTQLSHLRQVLQHASFNTVQMPNKSPEETSTIPTITANDESDHNWKIEKGFNSAKKNLKWVCNQLHNLPHNLANMSTAAYSENKDWIKQLHNLPQNLVNMSAAAYSENKDWIKNMLPSSAVKGETVHLTILKSLVNSSINSKSTDAATQTHHPGEVLNIITLLDTGGQSEYIHLLPTVNIHPMITFIVHDLSKNLDDQVLVEYSEHGKHIFKPYHLQYSNFDMIKFLMSSINDSLEKPSSKVPQLMTIPGKDKNSYLCCVGTHADKVGPELLQTINRKLDNMVENLDSKAAVWQNYDGSVLFPVDNTTAGRQETEDHIVNIFAMK